MGGLAHCASGIGCEKSLIVSPATRSSNQHRPDSRCVGEARAGVVCVYAVSEMRSESEEEMGSVRRQKSEGGGGVSEQRHSSASHPIPARAFHLHYELRSS